MPLARSAVRASLPAGVEATGVKPRNRSVFSAFPSPGSGTGARRRRADRHSRQGRRCWRSDREETSRPPAQTGGLPRSCESAQGGDSCRHESFPDRRLREHGSKKRGMTDLAAPSENPSRHTPRPRRQGERPRAAAAHSEGLRGSIPHDSHHRFAGRKTRSARSATSRIAFVLPRVATAPQVQSGVRATIHRSPTAGPWPVTQGQSRPAPAC